MREAPAGAIGHDARRDLFGGRGTVDVWQLGGACPPFTVALWCALEAGGTVGAHRQERDDELVIALDGEASIYVDGKAHGARPGSCVAVPLGSLLEIDNASIEAPFRYLIVKARRADKL